MKRVVKPQNYIVCIQIQKFEISLCRTRQPADPRVVRITRVHRRNDDSRHARQTPILLDPHLAHHHHHPPLVRQHEACVINSFPRACCLTALGEPNRANRAGHTRGANGSSGKHDNIAHIDEELLHARSHMRPRRPRSAPTHTPHPATTPENLFLHPEPRSQPHIMSWAAWHQTLHNLRSTHLIHAHEFINSTKNDTPASDYTHIISL